MSNAYNVYSKFDIQKHADVFINYLEICIDKDGQCYYAVPSHTMFLEQQLRSICNSEDEYQSLINSDEALHNWLEFLCDKTNFCAVWNDCYICGKNGLTKAQQNMLYQLAKTHYTKCHYLSLYQGSLKRYLPLE